jgi:hypothetical protein
MQSAEPARVLVENCRRISIRELILKAELIRPGQHTRFQLPDLPYVFRGFLSDDWNIGWIEIEGGIGTRWEIRRKATHLKHCWDDEHFFVLGYSDGKPARELLVSDTRAGTRSDLGAHYRSSHTNSLRRRLEKRRRIFAQLLILDDAADMARCYVPQDGAGADGGLMELKPRGMWWRTWWRRFRHSRPDVVMVPVRRPVGIKSSRFHRLLDQINAHHIRAGKIQKLSPAPPSSPAPSRSSPPPSSRQPRSAGAGDVDGSGVIGWMESVFKRP